MVLMGGCAQLQAMVHGVTTEECQAALQSHSWSVQRAAQYLKVPSLPARPGIQGPSKLVLLYLTLPSGSESRAPFCSGTLGASVSHGNITSAPQVEQLFGLGLRPRVECHKVLEMFDWNLEQAGCHLLGSCGPAHHK